MARDEPKIEGTRCNPCPICICPCWPRYNWSFGNDDNQCDFWCCTAFCGNLCEVSLCVFISGNATGYPHQKDRKTAIFPCTVMSAALTPKVRDHEFAAHHCVCCRGDDSDEAWYCLPYVDYGGKSHGNQCACCNYDHPAYASSRKRWEEWRVEAETAAAKARKKAQTGAQAEPGGADESVGRGEGGTQ